MVSTCVPTAGAWIGKSDNVESIAGMEAELPVATDMSPPKVIQWVALQQSITYAEALSERGRMDLGPASTTVEQFSTHVATLVLEMPCHALQKRSRE